MVKDFLNVVNVLKLILKYYLLKISILLVLG